MKRYVFISGSRSINDYKKVSTILSKILHINDSVIVGNAKGVDKLVVKYCNINNIDYEIYKASWNIHGKAAGPINNARMVHDCFIGFAIWDGISKGTNDAITKLKIAKKLEKVYYIK